MQYTATSASSFIGSLGVNTHLSWANTPYDNLSQVESELSYLGISNIRDDVGDTTQEYNALSTLMAQGVKVDMLGNTDLTDFMNLANNLETAHPGGITAVEGLNEVDGGSGPSYDGLTGYAAAIKFQQDLYTDVKADPLLANVAVYNTTVAGVGDTQYLGNLSAYATDANDHIYYGGGEPAWGWSTGDSTYYWTSWLASGQVDAPGLPTVVTETGATTTGVSNGIAGVDATTAAKQILNSLMDSAKNGVAMTYIYELADSSNNGPTDAQSNFGLFTWNGSAQPAAVAIHDLTSILGAGGPLAGTPGSLNYTIAGVPQWGGQMLFEQGNGKYDIVVWAEPTIWNGTSEVAAPNTPISVTLGTAANVSIYDPMVGTSPVESLGTTTQVNVNVVDHPIIIQVTPTTTTPPPPPPPSSTYTATAATISANFNALNTNTSVSSIVISDNAAVTLSVAQLQNAGHALGELQNANGSPYTIDATDTATNLSADLNALNTNSHLAAISISDGAALTLTAAQVTTDATALSEVTGSFSEMVADTGANISSDLSALAADTHLSSITVTDGAMLTVASSQYAADTGVLDKISGAHTVEITGYTGTSYTAEDLTYDANGALAERTYHNTNGTLSITGLESGLTFQSSAHQESITVSNSGDTFVFDSGFAAETISGYRPGKDVLDISHTLASSASAVLADASRDGHGGTLINFGDGETIELAGVSLSQLRHYSSELHFF